MLPKCRAIRRLMDRPVPWTPSAQNTRFSGRVLAASLAALEDGLVPCGRWPLLVLAGLASLQRDRVRGEGSSAQGRGQAGDELFEESLLAAGGEHAVHRLARIRQPEREQPAADLLTGQPDRHVPEVDLGLDPGPIRLRDERVARPPAGLRPDLTPPVSHVTPDHLVRHLIGAILTDQSVISPSRADSSTGLCSQLSGICWAPQKARSLEADCPVPRSAKPGAWLRPATRTPLSSEKRLRLGIPCGWFALLPGRRIRSDPGASLRLRRPPPHGGGSGRRPGGWCPATEARRHRPPGRGGSGCGSDSRSAG